MENKEHINKRVRKLKIPGDSIDCRIRNRNLQECQIRARKCNASQHRRIHITATSKNTVYNIKLIQIILHFVNYKHDTL